MLEWYMNKMKEAHDNKKWDDRRNYASAAKIDFVREFYLKP